MHLDKNPGIQTSIVHSYGICSATLFLSKKNPQALEDFVLYKAVYC